MLTINRQKLLNELNILEAACGDRNIVYPHTLEWVQIISFPLPEHYSQGFTDLLIMTPNGYGYGGRWEEIYLDPNLLILKDGQYTNIPHYHGQGGDAFNKYTAQGWRYFCIRGASEYLIEFLKQVSAFLSDPWRF